MSKNAIGGLEPLRPNPDWAKLPLFDRKGWKRFPFDAFAESVNERVEPANTADEIYLGLDDLDSANTHIIVERIVADIDDIVKKVRFPDWQHTTQGERLVQKELRKNLLKYKLRTDQSLFDRAYAYIKQYY